MNLKRGMKDNLSKYFNMTVPLEIFLSTNGNAIYDYTCFGVDENEKLSDDRYMTFYNQTVSPQNEIIFSEINNGGKFTVNLSALPANIKKLIFTVSIDGAGTMGEILYHNVKIQQGDKNSLDLNLRGADFQNEKAIISFEIYRKGDWKIGIIARGYNGGLSKLLEDFGGEEIKTEEKIVEEIPPQKAEKISLKKGEKISLTKKNNDTPIIIENGWTAEGKDYDLKALVRYRDGRLIYIGAANDDEVLSTPEGAVQHGGDIKNPGEMERILIKWHPDIASVAVSSYSALENGFGSFKGYGVFVRITNGKQIIEIPAESTSGNWFSYTLCFGEIIFGEDKTFEVSALEMYSSFMSEKRIGYKGDKVVMDIGPRGKQKSKSFWE